jgi:hypothetical protein
MARGPSSVAGPATAFHREISVGRGPSTRAGAPAPRPGEEIERDVRAEITGQGPGSEGITVTVSQGQAEIFGKVALRSRIPALMQRIRRVEGVVSAYSRLEWRSDDFTTQRYLYT